MSLSKEQKVTKVPRAKKIKNVPLSPFGVLYEVPDVNFSDYIDQEKMKKLSSKVGKEVVVVSLAFTVLETKASIVLMNNPTTMNNKTIMVAPNKTDADIFYSALISLSKEKEMKN